MAPSVSTPPEVAPQERRLLDRLLGLYAEESRLYGEVLDLSRRQRDAIRQGAPLAEVRTFLARKKTCLETIGRLESIETRNKSQWRDGRGRWSAAGRARLHGALRDVEHLIEQILACEEESDRALLEHVR